MHHQAFVNLMSLIIGTTLYEISRVRSTFQDRCAISLYVFYLLRFESGLLFLILDFSFIKTSLDVSWIISFTFFLYKKQSYFHKIPFPDFFLYDCLKGKKVLLPIQGMVPDVERCLTTKGQKQSPSYHVLSTARAIYNY